MKSSEEGEEEVPLFQTIKETFKYYAWVLCPKINFFWLHLSWYLLLSIVGSIALFCLEPKLSYIDSLFMSVSPLTSGLTTADFQHFRLNSQIMTWFWMILGSPIFVSLIPLGLKIVWAIKASRRGGGSSLQPAIRAMSWLFLFITVFSLLTQFIAWLILGFYVQFNDHANRVLHKNGESSAWWWSLFYTVSAYTSSGFTLFSSSLIPYSGNECVSLVLSTVVVLGQIGIPLFFWPFVWFGKKFTSGDNREGFNLLASQPRRFYPGVFPFKITLFLLISFFLICAFEFFIFFVEWNETVFDGFTTGHKLLIMYTQTAVVRTSGFILIDFNSLLTGHAVMYIISMYLSFLPAVLAVRSTAVTIVSTKKNKVKSTSAEAKGLLSRDILWLVFAVWIITFIEEDRKPWTVHDPFLSTVFEIMSAFSLVGFSLGFPGKVSSFSTKFHVVSKLIVIAVMLFGRHKGLPYSDEPCVRLNAEEEEDEDEEEGTGRKTASHH